MITQHTMGGNGVHETTKVRTVTYRYTRFVVTSTMYCKHVLAEEMGGYVVCTVFCIFQSLYSGAERSIRIAGYNISVFKLKATPTTPAAVRTVVKILSFL